LLLLSAHNLDDHLRNALTAQRLATLELLALQTCQRVENSRDHQHDCRSDEAGGFGDDAEPLYQAHYSVYRSAHVVGAEPADEGIECGGGVGSQ
jgi:hypothetical protein